MKLSRARVLVQILVHVVIVGHLLAYYLLGWKRVGGADVQAFFHDFLGTGLISAGVILAAVAFAMTLLLGRVFCGWGCHFGAFQDLAAWTLGKLGVRRAPIQTRILHHLPWALLAFAFILPPVLRWTGAAPAVPGAGAPPRFELRVELGGDPWANLPGLVGSVVTFLACGAGLLLFLGTRGFCRYVCPYGAVFRALDPAAPYRVRRKAACAGCGPEEAPPRAAPCTTACPMGVRVHQEAQLLGEVRDADCIRCNLCVEACPREALAQSFPALELPVLAAAPPASATPRPDYSFTLGQEVLVALAAAAAFAAWDLVYAAHFLAAAMALGEGFLALLVLDLFRRSDLQVLGLGLRRSGRFTLAGAALPAVFLLTLVPLVQAGAFKALRAAADRSLAAAHAQSLTGGEPGEVGGPEAAREGIAALERSAALYERALRVLPGDRLTLYRYAAALSTLGDRRAVALAEDLAARAPEDRDARELLRRVRARFIEPGGGLDNHPLPR